MCKSIENNKYYEHKLINHVTISLIKFKYELISSFFQSFLDLVNINS